MTYYQCPPLTRRQRLERNAWLWVTTRRDGPDRWLEVSYHRRTAASRPLDKAEATQLWYQRCFGVEFTDDATDLMLAILA